HLALQIQQDQYERMKTMPGVVAAIIKPEGWSTAVLNHKQGLMSDKRIRQAFQATLDMEPIMAAGFGNKAFYRLDPGLSFPEQRRNKPEAWDVFSTGITFNPEPAFSTAASCNWPGWWCHEDKEQWMDALARENDPRKRRAMWEKVQQIFYEDVGRVKYGDYF